MDTYFMSDFDEYQDRAIGTAIYPNKGANFTYPALGLAGETGEVCEKIKKVLRDNNGVIEDSHVEAITKELGDIMWYIAALAFELGIDMSDIALTNLEKLESRKERGKLSGNGDNR